ncbi:MAG TPA: DUF126 domain-containing protein [Segeticoccus sp.]|uniref:aconitase X swivel domain-containing protein n=1 Tax=Segeticoccus sp. TaxID=2706531 RepID=UPI002D7F045E|nr:DUF126 domain-containing protein [Segeticoccus sp.]HET8601752.1 DUF126 domain-containing protein [Segeticoccus sp.]
MSEAAKSVGETPGTVELAGEAVSGRILCAGKATGPVLALTLPLSFWGGVDHHGRIVDAHHPQLGHSVTGAVLAMASGRGSSSSSSVLAELIRAGAAPAAIVLTQPDAIITLGALAAAELYAVHVPVVQVAPAALDLFRLAGRSGQAVAVTALG